MDKTLAPVKALEILAGTSVDPLSPSSAYLTITTQTNTVIKRKKMYFINTINMVVDFRD